MYPNANVQNHLETSPTIETQSAIIADINLNLATNILNFGNYENTIDTSNGVSFTIATQYDSADANLSYKNSNDSDAILDLSYDQNDKPTAFLSVKENRRNIFSLQSCFDRFRPRSGINKAIFYGANHYIHNDDENMMLKPRYYIASKDDKFKYWSSYRQNATYNTLSVSSITFDFTSPQEFYESNTMTITTSSPHGYVGGESLYLDDGSTSVFSGTFVVLSSNITSSSFKVAHIISNTENNEIPIFDHFKWNVSPDSSDPTEEELPLIATYTYDSTTPATITIGPILKDKGIASLPREELVNNVPEFYIEDAAPFIVYNDAVPTNRIVMKIQTHVGTYDGGNYNYENVSISDPFYDAENEINNRSVPISWRVEYLSSNVADNSWKTLKTFNASDNVVGGTSSLNPIIGRDGYIELHYSNGDWTVGSQETSSGTDFATNFISPSKLGADVDKYKEFQYVRGLRVVVETMSKRDMPFELIELSPRLAADMTDMTMDFKISKIASDVGMSGMPVGQLLASKGSITFADYDQVFNHNNADSIIAKFLVKNIQFKFYEIVTVDNQQVYVPLKALYANDFPQTNSNVREVSIDLKDMYFHLDSFIAPQIVFKDVSLSYAIAMLMDSIGYSNYVYYKTSNANDTEPVIPFFFIGPETSVAEVLNDLARSTQTAMFFDENNNFVMMSKYYIMPSEKDRATSMTFYGSPDLTAEGIIKNLTTEGQKLANIIELSSQDSKMLNDGYITYVSRYIQKSYSSIRQASQLDSGKTWIYKPVLLWEISGEETTKSINEEVANQSAYALTAVPLASDLSLNVPEVNSSHEIINNVIDLGEAVYWMARYNGYFHANGEIIKFDAVEYNNGKEDVWISSTKEYRKYFSQLEFGAKIMPTGRVRIYAEPYYETFDNAGITETRFKIGQVSKHGRGQFGTTIIYHSAGLASYWKDSNNIYGLAVNEKDILDPPTITSVQLNASGVNGQTKITTTGRQAKKLVVGARMAMPTGVAGIQTGTKILSKSKKTATINKPLTATFTNQKIIISDFEATQLMDFVETETLGMFTGSTKLTSDADQLAAMDLAKKSVVTGLMSNFASTVHYDDAQISTMNVPQDGVVQSSALILNGPPIAKTDKPLGQISYIHKEFDTPYQHFGARIRILGESITSQQDKQIPFGASTYFSLDATATSNATSFTGSSGGISIMVNKNTGAGYYFELIALNNSNVAAYGGQINNVVFYKTAAKVSCKITQVTKIGSPYKETDASGSSSTFTNVEFIANHSFSVGDQIKVDGVSKSYNGTYTILSSSEDQTSFIAKKKASITKTAPTDLTTGRGTKGPTASKSGINKTSQNVLFSSTAQILVDDGLFAGQYRMVAETNPTVYDMAVEYAFIEEGIKFYLYLNNKLIGTVIDPVGNIQTNINQIKPKYSSMALFVRGSARLMFEKMYALGSSYGLDMVDAGNTILYSTGSINQEEKTEPYRKYIMPEAITSTYLSGISPIAENKYTMYYEEFGTIMREADYLNIKYDKAYPAFIAKIAPTFNKLKSYAVGGFISDGYGAEFLLFNIADTITNLDSTSGNFLRILGITFTNQSESKLTVDEYFRSKSNLSEIDLINSGINPEQAAQTYKSIQNSRSTYGRSEFNIAAPYIQSQSNAEELMDWLSSKVFRERKLVGMKIFSTPTLQLGDIVNIDYKSDDVDQTLPSTSRFVVYDIEYARNSNGPDMTIYLSEVF